MANLDDILSSAQGGQLIANLSQRFGLSEEETDSAVRALAPALGMGLHNAAEEPMALEKLFGLLAAQEQHAGYDDDAAAHSDDSLTQGRALLDDLFGSSSNTDRVVQAAARQSGVGSDILSQLLPVLASVLLGGLFKSVNNQGLGGVLGQLVNSGALNDILGQVLGGGGRGPQPGPMPPGGDGPFGGPGGGMGPGGGLGRAPGGGLGGLLGGILGSLLGGRGAPPGFPRGGGMGGGPGSGRGPLDPEPGYGGGGEAGLPEGIDQASVKDAIEQIQKTLQVGRGGSGGQTVSGAGGGQSDLESLLGQIFGKK